jgi:hypothetical protein
VSVDPTATGNSTNAQQLIIAPATLPGLAAGAPRPPLVIGAPRRVNATGVQTAFLDAMLTLIGDYDDYMTELPAAEAGPHSARSSSSASGGATSADKLAYLGLQFDREAALAAKAKDGLQVCLV